MNRNKKITFILLSTLILFNCVNSYALDLSRVKTWGDEILTSADLNGEFDNILNHELTKNDLSATAGILGTQCDFAVAPPIGATTPSTGAFTTLSATGALSVGGALELTGETFFKDKIYFTQSDKNEYIDSLADGYLDLEATTGLRFRINTTEQVNLVDGILQPTTDNDIDLGATTKEYKDLFIDGTANIDSLVADTVDINGGTVDAITSLTGANNLDIGAYEMRALTFESDQATGTAPLTVASTTKVTNLNVDQLDGYSYNETEIKPFGSWASATVGSSTLASVDSIICVVKTSDTGSTDEYSIKTDSANPPTIMRTQIDGSVTEGSMTCPIKKGEYYLITKGADANGAEYIIPMGI